MKKLTIFLILLVLSSSSFGQNKKIDSLKKILSTQANDTSKVNTYNSLCQANLPLGNFSKAIEYANKALKLAEVIDYDKGRAMAYNYRAYIYLQKEDYPNALVYYQKVLALKDALASDSRLCFLYIHIGSTELYLGNYPNALKNYLAALDVAKKMKNYPQIKQLLIKINGNIGVTYYYNKNVPQSIEYYSKMLGILKTLDSTEQNQQILSRVYTNIGLSYMDINKPKQGLKNYQEAIKIAKRLKDTANLITIYTNMASAQTADGQYASAIALNQKAIVLSKSSNNINGLADAFNGLGAVKLQLGKAKEAKELFLKSLEIAKKTQTKYNIEGNYKSLAEADSTLKNYKSAFENYKLYIIYRDSLQNKENTKKITQMQMQFKFDQEQAKEQAIQTKKDAIAKEESEKQIVIRNASLGALFLALLLALFIFRGYRRKKKDNIIISEQKDEIEKEKDKSNQLLYNILPIDTAEELKAKGSAETKHYDSVSVLFTDIVKFTKISEQLTAVELVKELDIFFKHFDDIIGKYNLEKIKTIGDAYMCAGGIPQKNKSNPVEAILAGLEMQRYMALVRQEPGKDFWQIRLGINTGELIAGVVGNKRFAYDVWGDTVNVASRMESSGEEDKVNISQTTYAVAKDFFECEFRGKVKAKNKGEVNMYFVHSIKTKLSVDGKGIEPNANFWENLKKI